MTQTPTDSRSGGAAPHDETLAFADLARLGRPGWWRYLVSLPAILVGGMLALLVVGLAAEAAAPGATNLLFGDRRVWREADTADTLTAFLTIMLGLGVFLPITLGVVATVHRRPWRSLITARTRFGWRPFWTSSAATVAISLLILIADLLADPTGYRLVFEPDRFFAFLPFVLLLTPLQVGAEEVAFRGYLLQMVSHATRVWVLRLVIPAVAFAALHFDNREAAVGGVWGMIDFLVIALYLGWLALRRKGIEEAIGFHLGNNLVAISVVTTAVSNPLAPTILFVPEPDLRLIVVATIILCGLHWIVISRFASK